MITLERASRESLSLLPGNRDKRVAAMTITFLLSRRRGERDPESIATVALNKDLKGRSQALGAPKN